MIVNVCMSMQIYICHSAHGEVRGQLPTLWVSEMDCRFLDLVAGPFTYGATLLPNPVMGVSC